MPFHQALHRVVELFTTHVLLLWLFSLLIVVALGLFLSDRRQPMFPSRLGEGRSDSLTKFRGLNLTDGISVIVFLIFLAFYILLIFYKEDFAYYDDDMLTDFSVQGRNFLPPVWSALGRFYPLADQEFNLLKFVTRSPAGYHALVALQLLVLVAVLFVVLRAFQVRYRVLIVIAAMVAPSFLIPFTGFVYPERNVLFWLAVMLLCLQAYSSDEGAHLFCRLPRGHAFCSLLQGNGCSFCCGLRDYSIAVAAFCCAPQAASSPGRNLSKRMPSQLGCWASQLFI